MLSFQTTTTTTKDAFEGMELNETELRVSNDKLPFRLVLETSNLDESKKGEFTLKHDLSAFLAEKLDPKKMTSSCDGCHKVRSCMIADEALEDLTPWKMLTMNATNKKPFENVHSKFNAVEVLSCGEASVNWKECERQKINTLARDDKDKDSTHAIGCTNQSYKSMFKQFLK